MANALVATAAHRSLLDWLSAAWTKFGRALRASHASPQVRPSFACSFCSATRETTRLISGPRVFICEHCVGAARGLVGAGQPAACERAGFSLLAARAHAACDFCGARTGTKKMLQRGYRVKAIAVARSHRICDQCLALCLEILGNP